MKVGRFGTQFTKWTLKQEDADIYTNLYQTDSGNILTDGGWLGFKLGAVGVQGFAGKFNTTPFSQAYVGTAIGGLAVQPTVPSRRLDALDSQRRCAPAGHLHRRLSGVASTMPPRSTRARALASPLGSPESLVFGATVEQFAIGSTITGRGNTYRWHWPTSGGFSTRTVAPPTAIDGTAIPATPVQPRVGLRPGRERRPAVRAASAARRVPSPSQGAYTVSAQGANSRLQQRRQQARATSPMRNWPASTSASSASRPATSSSARTTRPPATGASSAHGPTRPTSRVRSTSLKYPITPKLALNADYEQYRAAYATNDNGTPVVSPLQGRGPRQPLPGRPGLRPEQHLRGGPGLRATSSMTCGTTHAGLTLAAARRQADGGLRDASASAIDFNKNASFKLLYQIVHYNDHEHRLRLDDRPPPARTTTTPATSPWVSSR